MKTIKKNQEFQIIYRDNQKVFGNYCLIYISKTKQNYNRYGFVVSKKVGNAPTRNRIKRLFRETIRLNEDKIKLSLDIIIISKIKTGLNLKKINQFDIERDILNILHKGGCIK